MATVKKAIRSKVAGKRVAKATAPASAPVVAARAKAANGAASKAASKPATTAITTSPADKKPKRIRGEFSMPKGDYERIGKLKATAKRAGLKVKKNELLRLGLQALQGLPANELKDAIVALRVPRPEGRG
jgi:hypothetical protein